MADSKLSALTEATSIASDDEVYVNDSGTSKKITAGNLASSLETIGNYTTNSALASYIAKTDYGAQALLVTTNTALPYTYNVTEETVVGRVTSGNVTGIDPSSVRQQITVCTTSNYILVLTDRGKIVEMTTATVNTVVIPTNTDVAFPTGTRVDIAQIGGSSLTTIGTNSTVVTVNSARSALTLASQYSIATIYKRGTDEWVLGGDIT